MNGVGVHKSAPNLDQQLRSSNTRGPRGQSSKANNANPRSFKGLGLQNIARMKQMGRKSRLKNLGNVGDGPGVPEKVHNQQRKSHVDSENSPQNGQQPPKSSPSPSKTSSASSFSNHNSKNSDSSQLFSIVRNQQSTPIEQNPSAYFDQRASAQNPHLRKTAPGQEHISSGNDDSQTADVTESIDAGDLSTMTVRELRFLARRLERFPLTGRQISQSKRGELLELLRRHFTDNSPGR